jgi:hypothetical protein
MKTIKSLGPLLLVILCLVTVAGATKANGYSAISRTTTTTISAHHEIPRGGAAIPAAPFPTPMQSFVLAIKDSRRHLAAAAVARCVSIFGMYPVDTIKVSSTTY